MKNVTGHKLTLALAKPTGQKARLKEPPFFNSPFSTLNSQFFPCAPRTRALNYPTMVDDKRHNTKTKPEQS